MDVVLKKLWIVYVHVFCSMLIFLGLLNYKHSALKQYKALTVKKISINDSQLTDKLMKFENISSSTTTISQEPVFQNSPEERRMTLNTDEGLLDERRSFKIHGFAVTGKNWSEISYSWQVCLSTQASVNLMFWIQKQAEMWEGPLSVALFTPGVYYTIALRMIKYLQMCFPEIHNRVSFHIVYPLDLLPKYVSVDDEHIEYDCDQPEKVNIELVKRISPIRFRRQIYGRPYPQNLLRNTARMGCQSEYSFTPDVDMILNPGISKQLNEFVPSSNCIRCAYIIPTYEINSTLKENPRNKIELSNLLRKKKAQRFHIRSFSPNQGNSLLDKWEASPMTQSLDVLYTITSWAAYWEPIYIARATVPLYDERFIGYGHTRNTQVFEMHIAGYTWHMLNNAFLCHRGLQTSLGKSVIRILQIAKNRLLLKAFENEVYARYGKKPEHHNSPPKSNRNQRLHERLVGKILVGQEGGN